MMNTLGFVVLSTFAFVLLLDSTAAMSCPCHNPRFKVQCNTPTNCKGGITKDACGCCDVCAKVESESCGGPWRISGECDEGLQCLKENPKDFNANGFCSRKQGATSNLRKCRVHELVAGLPDWQCAEEETVYCSRDCESCCVHSTNCNPNPIKYVQKEKSGC